MNFVLSLLLWYRNEKENTERNLRSGQLRGCSSRVDGEVKRLDEEIRLARYEKHTIELVVDRLKITAEEKSRLLKAWKKHFYWVTVWPSYTTVKEAQKIIMKCIRMKITCSVN
ncbi:MAG: hypothetical protein CM1200mP30_28160 [Pseudomonadota bacterium]|nr:MAG: hypothetical protein CM1200mP30_28160 [Pseudomonadota bacterium]